MMMEEEEEVASGMWTTWEELLLGAAVLRHGARDWDRVSSEVRARIVDCRLDAGVGFTAEVCKAKYEELRERYSGCTAWFEELRMQRMLELRQAIEQSESSIGSLEFKLETLKAEQGDCYSADDDSSRTVSEQAVQKFRRTDSCQKEVSNDAASSDSFTREVSTNCSADGPAQTSRSPEEPITQADIPKSLVQVKGLGILEDFFLGGYIRKRRGKRKRKRCSLEVKEGSVGENAFMGSTDVKTDSQSKETLTLDNTSARVATMVEVKNASKEYLDELMRIFDSVVEHKCAAVFLHRLNCQKRGRYKKAVRQHMDFQTLRSRISSHTITSARELFRDILLLINNALVFYSKNTREYKSAMLLRDIVSSKMRQSPEGSGGKSSAAIADAPEADSPKTDASACQNINKPPGKVLATKDAMSRTPRANKKSTKSDSTPAGESKSALRRQNPLDKANVKRCLPPSKPGKGRKRLRTK